MIRFLLAILLLATPAHAGMVIGSGSCSDEACSGDCLFSSSWEGTGADNLNTGGTSTFDAVTGTVTYGVSNWETSCDGHSVTMAGNGNYLTSNDAGAWNKGTMYMRCAFQVTAESIDNTQYNFIFRGTTGATNVLQLRISQISGALAAALWIRHGGSVQQVGTAHGISLDTWYGVECYYNDVPADASEAAGWKLWDATGALIHPAAGFDEETNLDLNADGSLDTVTVGPAYTDSAWNITVEIDQVRFSGAAIGAPTR